MHNETHELIRQVFTRIMQELANLRHDLRHQFRHMETTMSADTDKIEAALTGLTDPIAAVEAAITQLVALVKAGNSDPASVDRVLATIEAAKGRIAAAAMAGTVADPNAPVDPNAPARRRA